MFVNQTNIWDELISDNEEIQKSFSVEYKKSNGIYFTGLELTDEIIKYIFNEIKDKEHLLQCKILEPCVGIGNYVFSFIKYIYNNYELNDEEIITILNNLYVCDTEKHLIDKFISNLNKFIYELYSIDKDKYTINIGSALIYNITDEQNNYHDIKNYFGDIKFDIIMTNPPYKHLRAEVKHYSDNKKYENDKRIYNNLKLDAKKRYILSNDGASNLYKYFIEEIIMNYSKINTIISILVPSNILSDKSNAKIREEIILNHSNISIFVINENDNNIKAKQSMVNINMVKNKLNQIIKFNDYYNKEIISELTLEVILNMSSDYKIKPLTREQINLINIMKKHPRIKDLDFIINRRGELDLTNNKEFITNNKTNYPLIKGKDISKYSYEYESTSLYVEPLFLKSSSKSSNIEKERIAGQQISNINKINRLNFTMIPEKHILGNSCNYLYVTSNKYQINNLYLLGILNSKIINDYFKIISSNNHVNNYEIDDFPVPLPNKNTLIKINNLVSKLIEKFDEKKYDELEKCIQFIFFKDENLLSYRNEKFEKKLNIGMKNVEILRKEDIIFKLSDLDLEIVESVPPGGNWRNIPQNTMNKSQRLLGIQKSGGRTTLYGRLELDKPSYTITTYFNRPGNGCNIHPIENRVISLREGARLQGFPNDYAFYGSQRDKLNQIGNAIPPFIGFLIAERAKKYLSIDKSLDLFSGAGGLLTGMKQAGISSKISNEIDESAAVTLKINHPEVNVICGDITDINVKNNIIDASNKEIDIVCGGPPCQGFSMAGFRKDNDPRNKLFIDFIDIVMNIDPKLILFENVTGILSSNKGRTYIEIQNLFKSLGYNIEGRILSFDDYGIPQKRKRLILIGVKNNLKVSPSLLFPETLTLEDNKKITVADSFSDNLYNFESDYLKYLFGKITAYEYKHLFESLTTEQLELFL